MITRTMTSFKALTLAAPLSLAAMAALSNPMEVSVEMRDGTELKTFVYLPEGEGPFPALVARTIYGPPILPIGGELNDSSMSLADYTSSIDEDDEDGAISNSWPLITESGYALVVQNTRGRNGSDGVDRSWRDDGADGYDLIEWINTQEWNNGRIGLFGDSAVGISAALAAAEQPPALDALFLQAAAADPFGTDMAPIDGALRTESLLVQGGFLAFDVSQSHVLGRGINENEQTEVITNIGSYVQNLSEGLEDPQSSETWMAAPLGELTELNRLMPFWSILRDEQTLNSFREETNVIGKIDVPTSIVTLWQDTFAQSSFDLFADLEEREVPRELLIVNGTHYDIDDPRIYPEPRMLSWFDHWLKDAPRPDRQIVKAATQGTSGFVTGRTLSDISGSHERFFMAEGTLSDAAKPDVSSFISDPANPVPTRGGRYLLAASGSLDQAELITREDTLIYQTEVFKEARILGGSVNEQIETASTAPSFDLSVRLLDIAPDGTARLVLSDHLRVEDHKGGPVAVEFDMSVIRYEVSKGHRLAVMIAGSDFPAWDRNPQTGESIFETDVLKEAEITVVNNADGVTYINIPFINS